MNRIQIGYDPAGGPDGIVVVEVRPRMHGLNAALRNALARLDGQTNRPPGPLDEYPSRAAHARAHRLRSEVRRRDRRRARTGRPPIRLRGRTRPRMLEITNALAPASPAFARVGQAVRRLAEEFEPALAAMQQRINEAVQALAAVSMPHRFTAGASPEWTAYDDVAAWRQRVDVELTESGRARREAELAEHYQQQAFERPRARAAVNWPHNPARHGGCVSPPCDPDDDTIRVRLGAGEVRVSREAVERYGAEFFQQLNGVHDLTEVRDEAAGPDVVHVYPMSATGRRVGPCSWPASTT